MDHNVPGPTPVEDPQPKTSAHTIGVTTSSPPPKPRLPVWVLPAVMAVAALVVGLLAGGIVGFTSADPTASDEFKAVAASLTAAQSQISVSQQDAQAAQVSARSAVSSVAQQSASLAAASASQAADLAARESSVAARESAVGAVEQSIAANSVGPGTWTVGVDIQPGTYRTAQEVGSDCYWEITRSGTNGSDIVENDLPAGGRPTVTLREGQDFSSERCGTWVKQ
jgi:hypothetical protein